MIVSHDDVVADNRETTMLLRTWRFLTILFVALDTGLAFCHALELPAKMQLDARLWLTAQHGLYEMFGSVGAVVDVGGVLAAIVLVILVRNRRPSFGWTLGSTICMAAALVAWFIFVAPMNAETARWTLETIPADWARVRDQWEYSHAARFAIQCVGLALLVVSVLVETPDKQS
jgi:hypothetical protein